MTQENEKIVIRARFLLPISDHLGRETRIEDGYVLLHGDRIEEVGEFTDDIGKRLISTYGNELQVIGNEQRIVSKPSDILKLNGVLLPGFVKAHGHDHESPIIGVAKDVPLTTWLDKAVNYFTNFLLENSTDLEKKLGDSPHLITYLKARIDDLSFGITSCLTHHCNFNKYHIDEIAKANEIANTKMILAVGSQDRNYDDRILEPSPEVAIQRLDKAWADHSDKKNFWIIPGPDQFFSNGPELLKALKEWASTKNTLIHCHSSEEPATTRWFVKTYGMTPVAYANSIGFLDEKTILAHQVNCTEEDLEILVKTRTKIVHNPLANTILGSGMPPIVKMIEKGIPVVISTDGSGSADNQNIINAARVASQFQKAFHNNAYLLTAQKVLEMVTVEPAKMLGLNCGSLEPGMDADVVLLDLQVANLVPTRKETVVENIIWAATGAEIRYVIVNGKVAIDDYKFTYIDQKQLLEKVQLLAEEFEAYMTKVRPHKGTGINK